jgi:hypothetical protein
MLKASLSPHIKDYTLEVKYGKDSDAAADSDDGGFEIVEKVMDALSIDVQEPEKGEEPPQKPISLFDESVNPDVEMTDASLDTSAGGKYSHVPPVPEPKFLQAPFVVPALYPFNRTTVYLLMSPETAQKQPKSVVLRGTSHQGPVELEIPVTVLADKGETIHQLAARKAVKELEDGRGWIYHAKDATDPNTALLKDKYPGRFKDMVEREAVRLGVTYQVGGKWCSFVAVEANGEEAVSPPNPKAGLRRPRAEVPYPTSRERRSPLLSTPNLLTSFLSGKAAVKRNRSPAVPLPPGTRSEASYEEPHRASRRYSSYKPGDSTAAPVSLVSAAVPQRKGGAIRHRLIFPDPPRNLDAAEEEEEEEEEDADGDRALGFHSFAAAAAPAPLSAKKLRARVPAVGMMARHHYANPPVLCEAAVPPPPPAPAAPVSLGELPPAKKLDMLVSLQGFSGAWKWEKKVVGLLGLKEGVAVPGGLGGQSDVLATAMVVVFLEEGLGELRDEWEMLVDKARGWLEGEMSGKTVEEYCEAVKGFLTGEGVL